MVLVCDPSRRDLELTGSKHFRAEKGRHGEGSNRHGARGEDLEIPVPPGTQGVTVDGSSTSTSLAAGQRAVVAHGGRGGHGNKRFANSTRQAPHFAERGTGGEDGWIELRLKLLADAGLIGQPNAGKSSLLGRLAGRRRRSPTIPSRRSRRRSALWTARTARSSSPTFPGLIEGAAAGAGLGHEFLAHVERCAVLVHLVDLSPLEGSPEQNYDAVRSELSTYGAGLDRLPELVVLSKRDLLPPDDVGMAIRDWRQRLGDRALDVLAVSSATGEGLDELRQAILAKLPEPPAAPAEEASPGEFEVEHRVYRPAGEGGYSVRREPDGGFRILGRGVELLFERHDLSNEEALAYLESRLNEIGVVAALRAAGFESGDDVRVGEHEFELHA